MVRWYSVMQSDWNSTQKDFLHKPTTYEQFGLVLQGDQLNMAVFFWYLVKSVLLKMSSVTRFVLSQSKVAAMS